MEEALRRMVASTGTGSWQAKANALQKPFSDYTTQITGSRRIKTLWGELLLKISTYHNLMTVCGGGPS